ncbi:hypothetical protein BCR33DRAFT_852095 [Rhizoclosmatium globosum]|uniref:BZIP domain-containing protein n=1 Tax=Rhizoclosmatium globosum TaxID=329046 RepID=A0A1Y2C3V9_9FUNG|nr:hypothetical protein BCR33DRAFT_852095 [Rhizoclosmatium globosum]|eukprot:ORY41574.1 hypothetical protein BCR33DRAFT_852095 [Rhizoclosmatium globosum]
MESSGKEPEPLVTFGTNQKMPDWSSNITETADDRKRAANERRALQNRIAQRLYRQRKDNRIAELEAQVAAMTGDKNSNSSSRKTQVMWIQGLERRVKELEAENVRLKKWRIEERPHTDLKREYGTNSASGFHSGAGFGVRHPVVPHPFLNPVLHAGYSNDAATMYPTVSQYTLAPYPTSYPPTLYHPLSCSVPANPYLTPSSDSRFRIPGNHHTVNAHQTLFPSTTSSAYPHPWAEWDTKVNHGYNCSTQEPRTEYAAKLTTHPALSGEPVSKDITRINPVCPDLAHSGPCPNFANREDVVSAKINGSSSSGIDCVRSESLMNSMIIREGVGDDGARCESQIEDNQATSVAVQGCAGVSGVSDGVGAFSIKVLLLEDNTQTTPS